MATKARVIIDQAKARSTFNDSNSLFLDSEAIRRIDLRLGELFSLVNQEATPQDAYFGKETTVDPASSAWARPTDMDVLLQIVGGGAFGSGADLKVTAGATVHLVPLNDKLAEVPPRVYVLGSSYKSVGAATDP